LNLPTPTLTDPPEPAPVWSVKETWLGLLLMVLVILIASLTTALLPEPGPWRTLALLLLEPALVLPVVIILARKPSGWGQLGFRRFQWDGLALGCGLIVLLYPLLLLHNLILVWLGVETQGDSITQFYRQLDAPVAFLITGAVLAPLAEETFFRGFLFTGLRQKYGWMKSMLISAAIFGAFHLQPAAFIPTFLLGCLLAFIRQRTGSLWPAIILHFLVNALALCATAALAQFTDL